MKNITGIFQLVVEMRDTRSTAMWLCLTFFLFGTFNFMHLYEIYANLLPYEQFWDVLKFGDQLQLVLLIAFSLLTLWSARGAYVNR